MDGFSDTSDAWYSDNQRPQLGFSPHALERCQQRGISPETVQLVYTYGTRQWSDGALAFSIDSTARRRMQKAIGIELAAQVVEQAKGLYLIVSAKEPVVITVARQLRRKRR